MCADPGIFTRRSVETNYQISTFLTVAKQLSWYACLFHLYLSAELLLYNEVYTWNEKIRSQKISVNLKAMS